MRWDLRTRLAVWLLMLIMCTLAALGSYILYFFYHHNIDNLTADLFTQAKISEELLRESMTGPQEKGTIDDKVKDLGTRIDVRLTVIDLDGKVLADSEENPEIMENHATRPEVIAALATGEGTTIRYSDTLKENMLYAAVPIRLNGKTVGIARAAKSLINVDSGFRKIRSVLLIAFMLASLLSVLLSFRIARKYTEPLVSIIQVARKMGEGHLDQRVHVRTGDELQVLSQTLNNLASNLDDKVNEIQAEKKKLELILEHMDNAVIVLDRYGRVLSTNKKAIGVLDIKPDMLGQHNIQVVGNSLFDRAVAETIRHGDSRSITIKFNTVNNKKIFQVFLAPLTTPEGGLAEVLGVFHDITTLQELYDRQSDFVANASHELSTPLTSIKGFAETLLDGALQDPDLSVKFVTIMQNEADRMHRLIQSLLQLARLDSQEFRQNIILSPTPVQPLLESAIQELAPHWKQKRQTVSVTTPPQPVIACANPDWLKQVLVNLAENSVKYTPEGGSVTLSCHTDGQEVVIAIQDTGIGIPQKDLPLIFDRFYRVDRARARTAGGTGLGLSIVKFIVDSLGGHIDVHSVVDVGTTFTIRLPLAEKNS